MAEFDTDFDGVKEQTEEFVLVAEGEYRAVITKVDTVKTGSGYPMAKTVFKIVEGEYEGKTLYDNIVFCEKMKGRNKHFLRLINQPHEGQFKVNTDDWMGQEVKVKVRHETYQGRKRAKISFYLDVVSEAEKNNEVPF